MRYATGWDTARSSPCRSGLTSLRTRRDNRAGTSSRRADGTRISPATEASHAMTPYRARDAHCFTARQSASGAAVPHPTPQRDVGFPSPPPGRPVMVRLAGRCDAGDPRTCVLPPTVTQYRNHRSAKVRVPNLTLMTDFHPTAGSSHHGRPKLVVREHLHGRYTDWVRVFGDAWTASTASAATSQCERDNPRWRQEAAKRVPDSPTTASMTSRLLELTADTGPHLYSVAVLVATETSERGSTRQAARRRSSLWLPVRASDTLSNTLVTP